MALLLADIPNPLDAIGDALGGVASSAAEKAFQLFMSRFADLLGDAAKKVSDELLHYLGASTGVNLDSGWFAGPRAKDILAVVGTTAGVLLVLFLLFAVIQGLLQGDTTLMLRSAFLEVPISVFGLLLLFVGANALLGITDALSGAVLSTAPDSLARFFEGFTQGPQILALGFIGMIGVFLFVLTAILLFVELIVRASLIYLLMAAAPLALAVRVWPQMRGVWHAFLRLGVAMIVSKLIVALALGLGAAALGGGGALRVGRRRHPGRPHRPGGPRRGDPDVAGRVRPLHRAQGDPPVRGRPGRSGHQPRPPAGGPDGPPGRLLRPGPPAPGRRRQQGRGFAGQRWRRARSQIQWRRRPDGRRAGWCEWVARHRWSCAGGRWGSDGRGRLRRGGGW